MSSDHELYCAVLRAGETLNTRTPPGGTRPAPSPETTPTLDSAMIASAIRRPFRRVVQGFDPDHFAFTTCAVAGLDSDLRLSVVRAPAPQIRETQRAAQPVVTGLRFPARSSPEDHSRPRRRHDELLWHHPVE